MRALLSQAKDDNQQYDTLLGELEIAKTFDLVLFRGTDFVSSAITKVSLG